MDEEALKKLGAQALRDWLREHKAESFEEVVRKKMFTILTKYKEDVLLKAMGFNDHWGNRWEVDRSNGRISIISKSIEESLAPIAVKWMEESLQPGIELTPTMKKTIREDVRTQLKNLVRNTHFDIVRSKVKAAVDTAVEEAKKDLLDDFSATIMFEHGEQLP